MTVVIIGDEYSLDSAPDVWFRSAAARLGWETSINMSTPARGYLSRPVTCALSVCANFMGTVGLVAEQDPDLVISFGGTADDDNDVSGAALRYYTALRAELPDAELVAVSPVTSQDEAPYWLGMHNRAIRTAIDSVGGTFVDVGQPGIGDGRELSSAAQDEIADAIVAALS